jgi:hypothetical protein
MLVTLAGMAIDVSFVVYENASFPMLASWLPSAKVTDVSEVVEENA